MRIAHVTDSYLPMVGGIELHVRDLARRQRLAGHEAWVVTRWPAGEEQDPDGVLRVDPRHPGWIGTLKPDLVHAHVSVVSPFALRGARTASYAGIPTVATVHSMLSGLGPLARLFGDLSGIGRWPVAWTAVSEAAAAPVRDLLGLPVGVLPNAVDLDSWSPPATLPDSRPPRVVAVMRLTRTKRPMPLARILREAARHVEVRATIVGDGPERPALTRYLRRHGLDQVRLTGTVDRAAVRRELAGAAVFLAPAHRESFGIAALEARASGLPVVASARSGVASYVTHGIDGFLGETDADLAAHLVRLLADDELRGRITAHNRLVRPPFSWAEADAATDQLYAAAIAGARLPRLVRGSLVTT